MHNFYNIGFPTIILTSSLICFIYIYFKIRKNEISIQSIAFWFLANILLSSFSLYILVTNIINSIAEVNIFNIVNWIGKNVFQMNFKNQEWIILLIFSFISFILIVLMVNRIKIKQLETKLSKINRELVLIRDSKVISEQDKKHVEKTLLINIDKVRNQQEDDEKIKLTNKIKVINQSIKKSK